MAPRTEGVLLAPRGLLPTHRGQYVAIHDGQVIASGNDLVDVAVRAHAMVGREAVYVDLVEDHPLHAVRIPYYRQDSDDR